MAENTSPVDPVDTGVDPEQDRLWQLLAGDGEARHGIQRGEYDQPHDFLGPHAAELNGVEGTVARAFHPLADQAHWLPDGLPEDSARQMTSIGPGQFAFWHEGELNGGYRLRFTQADGESWIQHDPYRFAVTVTDEDLYFFSEGTHLLLWNCLGARPWSQDGVEGWAFSVWAPNARRVGVVGNFNGWDGRVHAMRRLGESGMWEIFIPDMQEGEIYKFEMVDFHGRRTVRADPMARWAEVPPQTASRTFRSQYQWQDQQWMNGHYQRDVRRRPMLVYEVHLGSWLHDGSGEPFTYRELAPKLVEHVKQLGFNYLELLPVAEHPFDGSWGYQITGYFAPTSRFGNPDDFRFFVDYCHQHDIGVIVDWVPAHFVKDAHGLGRFDGTALYEHQDPRRGEHPDWGTYIFNYGRYEVRNFLVANALYWLQELHIDGLRVDAVASMLYLDYSRKEGEWLPNSDGGRENLEAIALLQEVNRQVEQHFPGRFTVAEESTAWPGITRSVDEGGLGFTLKWNMGWMHDSLDYFSIDPLFRSHHHDKLTFAMVYEYSEAFVNPLSHDEVVHGKGSLLTKMPGDSWRKFANLRALMAYQYTRPGKVLLFMGSELASPREWNHQAGLEWQLLEDPQHRGYFDFLVALGRIYLEHPCLWLQDHHPDGFHWITNRDRQMSVFAYVRWSDPPAEETAKQIPPKVIGKATGALEEAGQDPFHGLRPRSGEYSGEHLVIVLNLTPVPHDIYKVGVPQAGSYRVLLSSDDKVFGGSGYPRLDAWSTVDEPLDGCDQHLQLTLPPLSAMVLQPVAGPQPVPSSAAGSKRGKGKPTPKSKSNRSKSNRSKSEADAA